MDVSKVMKRQKNILSKALNTKKQTRNKKVISQGLLHFLRCVFPCTCDFKTHSLSKQSHSRLSLSWLRTASRETALITRGFWSHVCQGKTHRRKYRPLAWWHFFYFSFWFFSVQNLQKMGIFIPADKLRLVASKTWVFFITLALANFNNGDNLHFLA